MRPTASPTMSFGVQSVQQNVEWRELLELWRFPEPPPPRRPDGCG